MKLFETPMQIFYSQKQRDIEHCDTMHGITFGCIVSYGMRTEKLMEEDTKPCMLHLRTIKIATYSPHPPGCSGYQF